MSFLDFVYSLVFLGRSQKHPQKDDRTLDEFLSQAEFRLNEGGWGQNIRLSSPETFDVFQKNSLAGHSQRLPKIGDKISGEFQKSWILFQFVSVIPCGNPADMFFAEVETVDQWAKPEGM